MDYALIIRTKDGKEQIRWFNDPDFAFQEATKTKTRRDDIEWISFLKQERVW